MIDMTLHVKDWYNIILHWLFLQGIEVLSLTGPETLKLLQKIDIQMLLPKFEASQCQTIQYLWKKLLHLNSVISKFVNCPDCVSWSLNNELENGGKTSLEFTKGVT